MKKGKSFSDFMKEESEEEEHQEENESEEKEPKKNGIMISIMLGRHDEKMKEKRADQVAKMLKKGKK